jgi:hypothetical protein
VPYVINTLASVPYAIDSRIALASVPYAIDSRIGSAGAGQRGVWEATPASPDGDNNGETALRALLHRQQNRGGGEVGRQQRRGGAPCGRRRWRALTAAATTRQRWRALAAAAPKISEAWR